MIILDTSVLIHLLRGNETISAFLAQYDKEKMNISVATYAEMYIGFTYNRSANNKKSEHIFNALISEGELDVIPLDKKIARAYSDIQTLLKKQNKILAHFDGIIVATALFHKARLITFDKDFQRVPHLEITIL